MVASGFPRLARPTGSERAGYLELECQKKGHGGISSYYLGARRKIAVRCILATYESNHANGRRYPFLFTHFNHPSRTSESPGPGPTPPQYTRHVRPQVPITYTFSNWDLSTNSVILLPPADQHAPSYRISVSMSLNPLLPVSYITRIEMLGSREERYFVGEFELSLHQTRGILTIGDISTRLSNFSSSRVTSDGRWITLTSCGIVDRHSMMALRYVFATLANPKTRWLPLFRHPH
ncbi:hypothetical protein L218DRAFT_7861 [Marasmius fiardii PR-910]|nr:hypothetical protein L218DRAFT_7861 [Marasmius fiardii PR-910]